MKLVNGLGVVKLKPGGVFSGSDEDGLKLKIMFLNNIGTGNAESHLM